MKKYSKVIDGELIIKDANDIGMPINGIMTYGFNEEFLIHNGWSIYEYDLDELKNELIGNVKAYDTSENVNIFYLNNTPMWLNKETRVGLSLRFESELKSGLTETTLWYSDMSYILPIDTAIQMLHNLEMYASKCYDNTQYHLKKISTLQNVEELKNYDITYGYPDKLYFNI